jgi:hypothetical protein
MDWRPKPIPGGTSRSGPAVRAPWPCVSGGSTPDAAVGRAEVDGKIDGKIGGKIDGKIDGKIGGKIDGKIDGKQEVRRRESSEMTVSAM